MKTSIKSNKHLIVIAGPTGIGKSNISLKLAQSLNCDIIGADSRQVYKELSIGTAKPNVQERSLVKHWMVDSHSIHNSITTSQYEIETLKIIDQIFEQHNQVILTGGTGMYIKSIVEGLDDLPAPDDDLRKKLEKGYRHEGISYLQKYLEGIDPKKYSEIDRNNTRRLIRAIEIAESTKSKTYIPQEKKERNFNFINICLTMERQELYNRINQRVDNMLNDGLIEEVKHLRLYRSYKALQTVGYTELFDFLEEKHSYNDAVALIKRNSRRYAKRQMTWFRNQGNWNYFEATDYRSILDFIESNIS